MGRYENFKTALATAKNEHDIDTYLKRNWKLLYGIGKLQHNKIIVDSEFHIGNSYRADFVILSACSGYWQCDLIELQSPLDKIYTQKTEASSELREAIRQIEDWKIYIRRNEAIVREELAEIVGDIPAYCSNVDCHTYAKTEIRDPRTVIDFQYRIVIGRRSSLTQLKNEHRYESRYEIITYDRLLDYAKKLDVWDSERKSEQFEELF